MRRLTISGHACVETLALLITVAWADGRLDDAEKAGVRGAADVFNLPKEMRDRLDKFLAKPMDLDHLLFETFSPRDRAFAYVAAAWMTAVDEDVDEKEEALLDRVGEILGLDTERKAELERIARDLDRAPQRAGDGKRSWSQEVTTLFKAIPPRLEESADDFEVVFE